MDHSKFYSYIASYSKAAKTVKPAFGFITISRQTGAGGTSVGERLAVYLNQQMSPACPWTMFDKNLVHEVIKDHHLSQRIAPFLKETNIVELQDTLEDLLKLHPAQFTLVQRTNQTILRLAKMGHVILVGRGAPVITKDISGGIHVRLIASLESRQRHLMTTLGKDEKDVLRFIQEEDEGRAQYLKKYFDQDIDNPLLYDVIVNTDQMTYDDAVALIGGLVQRKISAAKNAG